MNILFSFFAVLLIIVTVIIGVDTAQLKFLFGVVIPYAAVATFLLGIIYHVVNWARSPVPFRIPTVTGQQKSLNWIKSSKLDSPDSTLGVIGRMALEILLFRSLFRNTKAQLKDGPTLVYGSSKYLWLGALVFHWSFLIIVLRHFRYFAEPIPSFVIFLQNYDGLFQIGLPILYITDGLILAALTFLFLRRLTDSKLKYISLASDYFPLLLIMSIAVTGILMRYFTKVDIVSVKELAIGLFSFNPVIPEGIGILFYIHLFLVCALLIYFPFSKLLHMPGVFLSPTRNLANNSRMKRHINPWNKPVRIHTYEEYEDEFRDKMKAAGLPLDKE
ncbi:MAG: sulfate reduction electron transfer complex DsrMKJOP subunit DsrM [Ignavibacteriaceae bacterium]|jgi:nitrate reductase gamma subunit|nr:sulfate reduction electron transfer complex DsrMKJOP subunit DsrM [Ignavibacteriaceae bacterium]MCW9066194.1 sulfate reduction electron transfer complex DsrMKJOP subunit DsrM [Ignavibacteriaceae bacterium]